MLSHTQTFQNLIVHYLPLGETKHPLQERLSTHSKGITGKCGMLGAGEIVVLREERLNGLPNTKCSALLS